MRRNCGQYVKQIFKMLFENSNECLPTRVSSSMMLTPCQGYWQLSTGCVSYH